ncbi:hypothetical protein, partial [Bacillus cereus group sp. BC326]|uniref:hypothetical protein n=1 Tax=Bacillus cereus group sp. BC326 TaxID=3445310 RepID=UPI003F6A0082
SVRFLSTVPELDLQARFLSTTFYIKLKEVVRVKSKLIMSGLAALGVMAGTSGAYALDDAARDAMAERLAPVGQLCLQGQDCGTASAPAAASG